MAPHRRGRIAMSQVKGKGDTIEGEPAVEEAPASGSDAARQPSGAEGGQVIDLAEGTAPTPVETAAPEPIDHVGAVWPGSWSLREPGEVERLRARVSVLEERVRASEALARERAERIA